MANKLYKSGRFIGADGIGGNSVTVADWDLTTVRVYSLLSSKAIDAF